MNDQSPTVVADAPSSLAARTRRADTLASTQRSAVRGINWAGLIALYIKEVRRFFKVQLQTVWAPGVTTLLYLVIFTVALGGQSHRVMGLPFADFIAPGLIVMAMMQNAFANASFSLLVGKIQGTIVDYLMPPLNEGELLAGLVAASITRALLVGGAIWLIMLPWPGVHIAPQHGWAILLFGLLGAAMLAVLGVMTSIWAEKFDHAAAVTNFVILPLSLLSGTFYASDRLAEPFRSLSNANPFHLAISGFRYGFTGVADTPLASSALTLAAVTLALTALAYALLRSGWKLKP